MAEVSKETEEKISQLQLLEQNLQSFVAQKQQFQMQLVEIESALKELEGSKESYRIVANIMVKADKGELKKGLESKKESASLRIKNLEKHENLLEEKAKKLQKEIMEKMKED